MADGQFGGNGSVHWFVNADEASAVKNGPVGNNGKQWLQSGVDYHDNPALRNDFTIRIKLPAPAQRAAWWAQLSAAIATAAGSNNGNDVLEFTLPIEQGELPTTQVQICWGALIPARLYDGLREIAPSQGEKKTPARAGTGQPTTTPGTAGV